jgi:hypothetical protein
VVSEALEQVRNLSKQKRTSDASKVSKSIKGWLVPTSSSSLPSTSSSSATGTATESNSTAATATAVGGTLNDDRNKNLDMDFSIFGILDEYNIFGEILESDENEDKAKPKYAAAEATKHLLENEAHVTRNVIIEKKAKLMAYQRTQALAIVRYLQLLQDGTNKMEASADVAMTVYQKRGIWSYKARSIRGWYLLTGENVLLLSITSIQINCLLSY